MGMGNADATDTIRVCYKEGYFVTSVVNLKVLLCIRKLNRHGFRYSLRAISITSDLQLSIMTVSQ
jgi:hypothetical protein